MIKKKQDSKIDQDKAPSLESTSTVNERLGRLEKHMITMQATMTQHLKDVKELLNI